MIPSWDEIKANFLSIKDLAALGSTYIISMIILGIFWIFIARILDVEEYGEIGFLISIVSIASIVSMIGSQNTLIVYRAKQVKIQNSIYSLAIISSLITSVVLFFLLANFVTSIYVVGYVIFGLVTSELLGRKLFQKYSKYLLSQRILMVSLALLFYYLIGPHGIILGYGLSFFPYSKLLYQGFKQTKFDLSIIQSRFRFIINSYVLDLAKILNGHLDKLIIVPLFGFAFLGNYILAYQVIFVLGVLPAVVFQYTLPRESSGLTSTKLQRLSIFSSIIIVILVIALSPFVFPTLFPKYTEVTEIVQIMSLNLIPVSISLMYTSKFLAKENSKIVFIGSGIRLIIQIPSIIILGGLYGITGVAASLVLASAVEAIWFYMVTKLQIN